MICTLYDYKGKVIYKTNTVENMNNFLQNDDANYNIINIIDIENNVFIDFGSEFTIIFDNRKIKCNEF